MKTNPIRPGPKPSLEAEMLDSSALLGTVETDGSFVRRPRLLDILAQSESVPLVLVTGPAGSGKTSLVADWVQSRRGEPTGWVTFEDGGTSFWVPLLQCLDRLGADLPARTRASAGRATLGRQRLLRLAATIAAWPQRRTIVLDGYEMVSLELARELDFLLKHSAGNLCLVFVSRVDPVLPLYRYRLEDKLVEVRAADLAFTDEEAAQLLGALGVPLSARSAKELNERLKGWSTGLRFAARALAEQPDPERGAATVVARTGDINEYLLGEVLGAQTPEVRQFLLDTCVVDQLTPELVDELVGPAGLHILSELAKGQAFIEPVSEQPGSYRYFPFFRELLRVQLAYESPERRAELHRRAARWFKRHDLVDRAIAHLAAVPAWDEAAAEIAQPAAVGRLLLDERGSSLHRVAAALPADLSGREACVVRAAAALASGNRGSCLEELNRARAAPADDPVRRESIAISIAVVDAVRGSLADDAETAVALAQAADRLVGAPPLPAVPGPQVQALVQLALGIAMLRGGDLARARVALGNAMELGTLLGFAGFRAEALGYCALVQALDGQLARATETASQALTVAMNAGVPAAERSPAARVALAKVALEQYDLDSAREHVPAATSSARLAEDPVSRAVADGVVAGLERAAGNTQSALARLDAAAREREVTDPWLSGHLRCEAARVRIANGEADTAARDLESIVGYDSREVDVLAASASSARGEVSAAKRSQAVRATTLPLRVEIPLLLVEVSHDLRRSTAGRARLRLARALRLAAPEEMRRPFREATSDIQRVLTSDLRLRREHEWLSHTVPRIPAQRDGAHEAMLRVAAPEVVETLTAKELEVLEHLEELLSTEEIAEKMFVSVNTVRTHVRSILRKLGVNRRNAAVRKARDLGILAP